MKRSSLLLVLCLLSACTTKPNIGEIQRPSVPATAPTVVVTVTAEAEAGEFATAIPLPTAIPTAEPTLEPTSTPHPYRSESVTQHSKDERFWYGTVNAALRERIVGTSFPEDPKDCPIAMEDLRYVCIRYVDFQGAEHEGELLVHRLVAEEVLDIFYRLYESAYPLASVRLVDDFGEPFNDNLSMAADNTSSFCCRRVTGSKKFSRHSYGAAIDINPVENPYIRPDGSFAPDNSGPYLDRSELRPGMIDENDLCYRLFTEYGWSWGGHFRGEKDYQHFSKDLGL